MIKYLLGLAVLAVLTVSLIETGAKPTAGTLAGRAAQLAAAIELAEGRTAGAQ